VFLGDRGLHGVTQRGEVQTVVVVSNHSVKRITY
jgi:hypothetical protein